jgi:hypothetical protein
MNINITLNKILRVAASLVLLLFSNGCEVDDPVKEEVPELITKVTLTFSPTTGGSPIVTSATDPDGEGVQDIQVDGSINLDAGTTYSMTLELINGLAQPSDPAYNITEEVEEEADEHLFFFSWSENIFADPAGDGNIDSRGDALNYEDEDTNNLPLGLETSWTTGTAVSGSFRVVLKHQPDLKSETSDANTGETDLDITFDIHVN